MVDSYHAVQFADLFLFGYSPCTLDCSGTPICMTHPRTVGKDARHCFTLSYFFFRGRLEGIVALDLLNCTSVQSAPSPTHPSARDDIETIGARSQSMERDGPPLMDMLVPFHMLYTDGVERLAAESLLGRQKWVNRLWYVFYYLS